jgi:hypothetical protein
VTVAGGGEAISDISGLTDQSDVHGSVASGVSVWRVLAGIDPGVLADLNRARAVAKDGSGLLVGN